MDRRNIVFCSRVAVELNFTYTSEVGILGSGTHRFTANVFSRASSCFSLSPRTLAAAEYVFQLYVLPNNGQCFPTVHPAFKILLYDSLTTTPSLALFSNARWESPVNCTQNDCFFAFSFVTN